MAMPEMPRSAADIVPIVNAMTCDPLAPTWSVTALAAVATEPERILTPLNSVSEATRAISATIDWTSWSRLLRWRSVSVPLAAWTERSRIALEHVVHSAERAVCDLHHRDAVLRVARGDVHAPDLGAHLLADREARRVIGGAVDAQTGGQALHRLAQLDCSSTRADGGPSAPRRCCRSADPCENPFLASRSAGGPAAGGCPERAETGLPCPASQTNVVRVIADHPDRPERRIPRYGGIT